MTDYNSLPVMPDGVPTFTEEEVFAQKKMWPWYTAVGVLTSLLVLVGVAFGIVVSGLNSDLEASEAALAATQADLTSTQNQLTDARNASDGWENVADKWRLCGIASLEISQALLTDGIFAAGVPIGEAGAKCEEARTAQTSVEGGSFA